MIKLSIGPGSGKGRVVVERNGVSIDLTDAAFVKSIQYGLSGSNLVPILTIEIESFDDERGVHLVPWVDEPNDNIPPKKWLPTEAMKKKVKLKP